MRSFLTYMVLHTFLLSLTGCAIQLPEPCLKDGREYCVTDEWIFSESWYSCYLRGLSCVQGGCWENAKDEFLRAIDQREVDARWVRTYGMHRLPEYFPHRELGISYYHLSEFDEATQHLGLSLKQCESSKTKYYLNKARRELLIMRKEDKEPPFLLLDPYYRTVATPSILLSGTGLDDTFVANVLIRVNDEEQAPLMELSRPLSHRFRKKVPLRAGINTISIKVVDLLGNEDKKKITVLVDQEGPMIYFTFSRLLVQGVIADPSGVSHFWLNGKEVKCIQIEESPYPAYSFTYRLSSEESIMGILLYRADDTLHNSTSGSVPILTKKPPQIAMASHLLPLFSQEQDRQGHSPVKIITSQVPQETFQEEVCPQITILARRRIKEIIVNEEPVLSTDGLDWAGFFDRLIREYFAETAEGRFLFSRMITLQEGDNTIRIKVIDYAGEIWEELIHVVKKTNQIHKLKERWRMAIPTFLSFSQPEDKSEQKEEGLTYQLMEAFIHQERFRVIDLENLPFIIDEKRLSHYLGSPFLGLSSDTGIWIDTLMLGYIQQSVDSLTLSASMVDLETGEILTTKDVCEQIDSSELRWKEDFREHTFHLCLVLAAKFKEHFPLCEGKVISLKGEDLRTGICRNDGLKGGMKLILYTGNLNKEEDLIILADARVQEVGEHYSRATLLHTIENAYRHKTLENLGVITR